MPKNETIEEKLLKRVADGEPVHVDGRKCTTVDQVKAAFAARLPKPAASAGVDNEVPSTED